MLPGLAQEIYETNNRLSNSEFLFCRIALRRCFPFFERHRKEEHNKHPREFKVVSGIIIWIPLFDFRCHLSQIYMYVRSPRRRVGTIVSQDYLKYSLKVYTWIYDEIASGVAFVMALELGDIHAL